jgi:hypothetical protein
LRLDFRGGIRVNGKSMHPPDHFEIAGDYAHFRPVGQVTFQEAIALMRDAITHARECGVKKLLAVSTGLTGYPPPSTLERFQLGKECAVAAQGVVAVALVAPAEMIDPQRFGVTVARNRNMLVDVFTTETDALAWLLAVETE